MHEVLLPLIQQAYVRVFESTRGKDPENWTFIGKQEFGPYAPFQLPSEFTMIQEAFVQDIVIPFFKTDKAQIPFGFLVESEKHLALVFRGTVAPVEWINNGFFLQRDFRCDGVEEGLELKVHGGFLDMFKMVRTTLKPGIEYLEKVKKPLVITGHSLGSAIAQMAALWLAKYQPEVVTFGGPRVGSPDFVKHYNKTIKKSTRVVNGFDPVPALPPKLVLEKGKEFYKHTKTEINIYAGIKKLEGWKQITDPDVLYSHLPTTYLKALENTLHDLESSKDGTVNRLSSAEEAPY